MIKTVKRLWLSPLLCLYLALPTDAASTNATIASVAGQPITLEDYQKSTRRLRLQLPDHSPGEMLQPLIDRKILRLEAERRGLAGASEVIQTVDRVQRRRLAEKVYEQEATGKVAVSEADLRAYFTENDLDAKREMRASHIGVATFEEAGEVMRRLAAGEEFADLARECSMDSSTAANGGDMGFWQEEDSQHSTFASKLFDLRPGAVSQPFRDGRGIYHIIKATEERPVAFDAQRPRMRKILERQQKDALWTDFLTSMKEDFQIRPDTATLNLLLERGELAVKGIPPIAAADLNRVLLRYAGGQVDLRAYVEMLQEVRSQVRPHTIDSAAVAAFIEDETVRNTFLPQIARARGLDQLEEVKNHVEDRREQVMVELLRRVEVEERIVTKELLRAFYEEHQDTFTEPKRTIFAGGLVEGEADGRLIADRVRNGEPMARVMRDYPTFKGHLRQFDVFSFSPADTSAAKGALGIMIEEVRGHAVGDIVGPIRIELEDTGVGYLVLELLAEKPARLLPFEDPGVQKRLWRQVAYANRAKIEGAFEVYLEHLREKYAEQVVVNDHILQSLDD